MSAGIDRVATGGAECERAPTWLFCTLVLSKWKEEKRLHFYKIAVKRSKTHIFHIAVQSHSTRTEMDRRIMKGKLMLFKASLVEIKLYS